MPSTLNSKNKQEIKIGEEIILNCNYEKLLVVIKEQSLYYIVRTCFLVLIFHYILCIFNVISRNRCTKNMKKM